MRGNLSKYTLRALCFFLSDEYSMYLSFAGPIYPLQRIVLCSLRARRSEGSQGLSRSNFKSNHYCEMKVVSYRRIMDIEAEKAVRSSCHLSLSNQARHDAVRGMLARYLLMTAIGDGAAGNELFEELSIRKLSYANGWREKRGMRHAALLAMKEGAKQREKPVVLSLRYFKSSSIEISPERIIASWNDYHARLIWSEREMPRSTRPSRSDIAVADSSKIERE